MKSNPKILVLTLPLRFYPTEFPPLGSLSVITSLKRAGFENTRFYNIDLLRPEYDEIIAYIREANPEILGISAVVSTAYQYTKKLSLDIKKILPDTTIILGGNLGSSAEILLQKTGVDFICTGEGERTVVDFVKCWLTADRKNDFHKVKGLSFLDEGGDLVVTPYAEPLKAEHVYDIDWSILEGLNQMECFVRPKEKSPLYDIGFSHDPRTHESHRKGKSITYLVSSKGCVAKCTFCHRWDAGIRYIPVPTMMQRIDYFISKYNIGFINFGDENFGTDKRWLTEFLREIKKRDLVWRVGGIRVSDINLEWVKKMKDAGCSSMFFGMESGSQKMLDVMGKVTTVEQNMNVVKWLPENGVDTCLQLILGMPGETPETIRETMDFVCFYAENSDRTDPNKLGINFAQALPGTPLYEYARRKGLIGQSLDEEEKYLLGISDRDARDGETYINFTDYPKLLLEKWHFEMQVRSRNAFINQWGIKSYDNIMGEVGRFRVLWKLERSSNKGDSGFFAYPARAKEKLQGMDHGDNDRKAPTASSDTSKPHVIKKLFGSLNDKIPSIFFLFRKNMVNFIPMYYPRFFWRIRFFSIFLVWVNAIRKYSAKHAGQMLIEYLSWRISEWLSFPKDKSMTEYISLRKIINKNILPKISTDNPVLAQLRKGR